MKSFKFRFETLLKTKTLYVNQALQEFESAKNELANLREKENAITLEIESLRKNIFQIQTSLSSLHELEENQFYFTSLQEQIVKLQDEIFLSSNVCAQKKAILKNTLKEKKIFEKLKEKQYKEWNDEVKRLEGKQVDEAAVTQFLRNSKAQKYE